MKKLSIIATAFLLVLALPVEAQAQADVKIGPRIGIPIGDFSDAGGNLFFGADARLNFEELPVVINPSFDYYLMDDVGGVSQTLFTIDANALYEFAVDEATITPYAGGGIGIARISAESNNQAVNISVDDTDVALNLVGGARFPLESIEPFVQANVGVGGDFDRFALAGGVLFSL